MEGLRNLTELLWALSAGGTCLVVYLVAYILAGKARAKHEVIGKPIEPSPDKILSLYRKDEP